MTKQTTDCLIIGGGIIGMITAQYLIKAGLSVKLLEKGHYGKQSSWAGAGILSPLYPWRYSEQVNKLSQASQKIYPDFCQTLEAQTGLSAGYRPSGLLIKDDYNKPAAKLWLEQNNVSHQYNEQGLLFDNVGQVRNPDLLKALEKDISQLGVEVLEQQTVLEFIQQQDEIIGVKTQNNSHYAKHTIVCGGAWSGELLKTLSKVEPLVADIYPMRGQILLLELPKHYSLDKIMPHIVLTEDKYFVPRTDNLLLIGSNYESVGFDSSITQQAYVQLHQFALKHYPILAKAKLVKQWAGLRPATHSGKIYIGAFKEFASKGFASKEFASKKYQGLYFNAGHFSNGINTALASADIIKDTITQTASNNA